MSILNIVFQHLLKAISNKICPSYSLDFGILIPKTNRYNFMSRAFLKSRFTYFHIKYPVLKFIWDRFTLDF